MHPEVSTPTISNTAIDWHQGRPTPVMMYRAKVFNDSGLWERIQVWAVDRAEAFLLARKHWPSGSLSVEAGSWQDA